MDNVLCKIANPEKIKNTENPVPDNKEYAREEIISSVSMPTIGNSGIHSKDKDDNEENETPKRKNRKKNHFEGLEEEDEEFNKIYDEEGEIENKKRVIIGEIKKLNKKKTSKDEEDVVLNKEDTYEDLVKLKNDTTIKKLTNANAQMFFDILHSIIWAIEKLITRYAKSVKCAGFTDQIQAKRDEYIELLTDMSSPVKYEYSETEGKKVLVRNDSLLASFKPDPAITITIKLFVAFVKYVVMAHSGDILGVAQKNMNIEEEQENERMLHEDA